MRNMSLMSGTGAAGLEDVRSGGAWTPAQRRKNDAIWVLSSLALLGLGRMPVAVLRLLGRGLGLAAHALVAGARRTAEANVERALPIWVPSSGAGWSVAASSRWAGCSGRPSQLCGRGAARRCSSCRTKPARRSPRRAARGAASSFLRLTSAPGSASRRRSWRVGSPW